MDRQTVGGIVNLMLVSACAGVAAWRGFHRRRSRMSRTSWIGFIITLVAGVALIAFGLLFANAVDHHAAWVGPPKSPIRVRWMLLSLGSLTAGVVLSFLSLGWFGYADPAKQFPLARGSSRHERAWGIVDAAFVVTGRFVSRHERESLMSHLESVSPLNSDLGRHSLRWDIDLFANVDLTQGRRFAAPSSMPFSVRSF